MSAREESIDLDAGLRATYVFQFFPEQRELLHTVCSGVLRLAREARLVYPSKSPVTLCEIQAVAADLRFLQAYLVDMHEDDERTESREEFRACELAGRLAPELGNVAASLEAAASDW